MIANMEPLFIPCLHNKMPLPRLKPLPFDFLHLIPLILPYEGSGAVGVAAPGVAGDLDWLMSIYFGHSLFTISGAMFYFYILRDVDAIY